jgi:hypothetical protein
VKDGNAKIERFVFTIKVTSKSLHLVLSSIFDLLIQAYAMLLLLHLIHFSIFDLLYLILHEAFKFLLGVVHSSTDNFVFVVEVYL